MKVLSLLQQWASLCVSPHPHRSPHQGVKGWETRSWRPSSRNHALIHKHGMLIHASKALKGTQRLLIQQWPFSDYIFQQVCKMPMGAIIGHVMVGEILTTEGWVARHSHFEDGAAEHWAEEHKFGDYGPGRYAWELLTPTLFETPIEINGALSLWDYNGPLPELKQTV